MVTIAVGNQSWLRSLGGGVSAALWSVRSDKASRQLHSTALERESAAGVGNALKELLVRLGFWPACCSALALLTVESDRVGSSATPA